MNGIIKGVGLTLRLPVFILGTLLATALALVIAILSVVVVFIFIPAGWIVFKVPSAFFTVSARGNASQELRGRLGRDIERWNSGYRNHFTEILDNHRRLWSWLVTGS